MFRLTLLPAQVTCELEGPVTLAKACQDNDLPVPFGCYGGHCTTCAVAITQGRDHVDDLHAVERYSLTADELADDIRLGCRLTLIGSGDVTLTTDVL